MGQEPSTEYRRASGESYTEAIVEAVARARDAEPEELPPLYEAVDTDALDSLMTSLDDDPEAGGTISFTYVGYVVTVDSDGRVVLDPE